MINSKLQREIISHVLGLFGIFNPNKFNMIDDLISDRFLLEKKIAFEAEDRKKYYGSLWAGSAKIENSRINAMVADIKEDIAEFALIIQMDTFPPYALRISSDVEDFGEICIGTGDNKWINVSIAIQAKFLSGIEGLNETLTSWEKVNEYEELYKLLVGFLNNGC